ncbi:MAG: EAL domain-containing protein [Gammaproteobacteria bacterium]|nr:EAL domain-containing protein [Gammaproteobacteria bacterium]
MPDWTDLSITRDNFIGKTDYDMFSESLADTLYRLEKNVFSGSNCEQDIIKYQNKNKELRWLRIQTYPIYDTTTKIIGIFSLSHDITEEHLLKQQIVEIQKRNNQYEILAKIGHWELNIESNNLCWSDEIFNIFEIDKKKFGSNYECFLNCIHPDDKERVNQAYLQSLIDKKPYSITHRLLMSDGRIKYVHEECTTDFDLDGKPIISRGTVQDISELIIAQEKLINSEKLLSDIIENLPIRVFWKDRDGCYLGCNSIFARDAGKKRSDEVIGKYDFDMAWSANAELYRADDFQVMKTGLPKLNYEEPQTNSAGEMIWLRTSKVALKNKLNETIGVLGIYDDITTIKNAEQRIKLSAQVFTYAREAIIITDKDANIIDVNKAFSDITGFSREEVLNKNPRILHSGKQDKSFYQDMWQSLLNQGYWSGEIWNRRKDGSIIAELETISAVYDERGKLQNYIALYSDISAIKEHQHQLEHIAHYDYLTGKPNRVLLAKQLRTAMLDAKKNNQRIAVAYLDLDEFKSINDKYGHEIGDNLLIALANRLDATLTTHDILARIGGDEFALVISNLPSLQECNSLFSKILSLASSPISVSELLLPVTVSLGVTFYPQENDVDADQLLRQADQAMYHAKQAGKNRFHFFDAEYDRSQRSLNENIEQIRASLVNNDFLLFYQPKVNMLDGSIVGVEALIRWQHPKHGLLAPSAFLPMIENHQVSIELGEWVIRTAIQQIAHWKTINLSMPVSVNVNALQLQHPGFLLQLQTLLNAQPSIAAGDLELEILETSALEDFESTSKVMQSCQSMGINFAVDDFGTGYSSLTYLKQLSAEVLKIDQSFVRDMLDDPDDLAILKAILGLATTFNRRVIAEGVETLEHGKRLLEIGCLYGQGYAIARPMPAAEIIPWIKSWKQPDAWKMLHQ